MSNLKRVTMNIRWVSPEYERKLHKRGLCIGAKCPLRVRSAPRPLVSPDHAQSRADAGGADVSEQIAKPTWIDNESICPCGKKAGPDFRYGLCDEHANACPPVALLRWGQAMGRAMTELAAAEERGRRRGVEERDGLRARVLIGTDKILHLYALDDGTPLRAWLEGLRLSDAGFSDGDEVLITRAALAPRDSGPQPARMDAPGGPVCWCGKPSRHQSGWCGGLACQGGAPRDSGKEG